MLKNRNEFFQTYLFIYTWQVSEISKIFSLKFNNLYIVSCARHYWIINKKNILNSVKNACSMLKKEMTFFLSYYINIYKSDIDDRNFLNNEISLINENDSFMM